MEIAPGSPCHRLGQQARTVPDVAHHAKLSIDADAFVNPKIRQELKAGKRSRDLRQSAMPSPAALIDKVTVGVSSPLRQSCLSADSATAKMITTMENADIDAILVAVAAVIHAYTTEASSNTNASKGNCSTAFNEDRYPIDGTELWRAIPSVVSVEAFLRTVTVALELDESSLVIALILIERALQASPGALLILSARNWRPLVLMAIAIASKVVYDEKVFLADYRDQLPQYCLSAAPTQERAFLELINFNTNVRRGQYAKYYYALEDVARMHWANETTHQGA